MNSSRDPNWIKKNTSFFKSEYDGYIACVKDASLIACNEKIQGNGFTITSFVKF